MSDGLKFLRAVDKLNVNQCSRFVLIDTTIQTLIWIVAGQDPILCQYKRNLRMIYKQDNLNLLCIRLNF